MKQVLQDLKTGGTGTSDVPCPRPKAGELLIATCASLISAGTEKMLVEFGHANLIEKARQQPDKVRIVIDKIRTDGLLPAISAVWNKLDQPLPLGYCNAGKVIEVGAATSGFSVGERVASNGKHAEVVAVPMNLCARIPDGVSDVEAAFTPAAAVALQGLRLAEPTLGEVFVVTGLGLIGLITVQLLRANGCRVLGIDYDEKKLVLARKFGAQIVNLSRGEDPLGACAALTQGRGADGVIITASTTSNEPVHQAARMCRKRGRIVLVGVAGLELSRADFFEKELRFQVSCSYGPGRHDSNYEERGQDYPLGFVRWTEQRNFEAVLDLLAQRKLDVQSLITHRLDISRATEAYALLSGTESYLGIVLEYPHEDAQPNITSRTVALSSSPAAGTANAPVVGVVGAGNYGSQVLVPAFRESGARLKTIATSSGVNSIHVGNKNGFELATSDWESLLSDSEMNALAIATRHDTHARFACAALRAGKHVFVEKPLAIRPEELTEVEQTYKEIAQRGSTPILMVGFNRRFAPQVARMHELLSGVSEPKVFVMTVNAGAIPSSHWTQEVDVGGGRIIGEACHFVDLLRHLAGAPITAVQTLSIGGQPADGIRNDKVSFSLSFADGSMGTVHYLANGHRSFPKERLEVFCAGRILQLDNFRKLTGYGWPGFRRMNLWRQDKGHRECVRRFVSAVREGKPSPIPAEEIFEVTRICFTIAQSTGSR